MLNKSKSRIISTLIILIIAPLLTQCASQDEINTLNYQIRTVNNKVNTIKKDSVTKIQRRQASSANQITNLNEKINALNGKIEEIKFSLNKLTSDQKKSRKDISLLINQVSNEKKQQIDTLNKKLSISDEKREQLALSLTNLNTDIENLNLVVGSNQNDINSLKASRIKDAKRRAVKAAKIAKKAREKAVKAAKFSKSVNKSTTTYIKARKKILVNNKEIKQNYSSTDQKSYKNNYENGLNYYNKGQYSNALTSFENYITSSKDKNLSQVVEASFMMGESLYKLREFDKAILEYQRVISNYSHHEKAPSAIYKQARCFERLNDKETARSLYRKIISAYKDSSTAKDAKKRLNNL